MQEARPGNGIFREKSMERVSSPEALNDYIRVTTPSVWIVLIALVILLTGMLAWSIFGKGRLKSHHNDIHSGTAQILGLTRMARFRRIKSKQQEERQRKMKRVLSMLLALSLVLSLLPLSVLAEDGAEGTGSVGGADRTKGRACRAGSAAAAGHTRIIGGTNL